MSEQSPKAHILQPAAELEDVISSFAGADLQPPLGVEQFLDKETHLDRARRIGRRAIYGKNLIHKKSFTGASISTIRPDRYNVSGYVENVAGAIDGLIAEAGEFPESLYDVAETAAAVISREDRNWEYFSDDPQGVEAVGILKAITSRPAFIKNSRAEEVLSNLGQASSVVCGENMFTQSRYPRQDTMKDGYDVNSVKDFQRIATSDALWTIAAKQDSYLRYLDATWPLTSCAKALEVLAVNHPGATQQARLDVLRKNETSAGNVAEVEYHLVYTFNTDEEKAFLASEAEKDAQQETGSVIAKNILKGRYDRTLWAI